MKLAVVGCGIAGINVLHKARGLDRKLEIVAIDPKSKSECQALHPEVLSGKVKPEEAAIDIRQFTGGKGIRFINEKVTEIKLRERTILTSNEQIKFDKAVIATGAVPNFFGIPGAENCFSINSLEDTLKTKEALAGFKSGDSVAIIGAGLTGIEAAGELLDIFKGSVEVHIIELLADVLPGMDASLCSSVFKYLAERGAKIHTSTRVREIQPGRVITYNGEIKANLVLWCAGIKPSPLAESLDVLKSHGWIAVDPYLRIMGHENVYAVGDIASVEIGEKIATKCALEAERQGCAAAVNAVRAIDGKKPLKYEIKSSLDNPVMLVSLGGNKAVAGLGDYCFSLCLSAPSSIVYRLKKKIDRDYVRKFSK